MKNEKISRSINMIADATETGYTALFTFAVKETLSTPERTELVNCLRALASDSTTDLISSPQLEPLNSRFSQMRK